MTIVYNVDLKNKRSIDKNIKPTETTLEQIYWLYAVNNKYPDKDIDHDKIGKWMIFVNNKQVNDIWEKIKEGIFNSELWHAKVSTINPNGNKYHAIMIYTKDYTDLEDIVRVLDYLEKVNIKASYTNLRYKTNQQTSAGIYAGGKERPWIYTSSTIRSKINNNVAQDSIFSTTSAVSQNSANRSGLYVIPALRANSSIGKVQPSLRFYCPRPAVSTTPSQEILSKQSQSSSSSTSANKYIPPHRR